MVDKHVHGTNSKCKVYLLECIYVAKEVQRRQFFNVSDSLKVTEQTGSGELVFCVPTDNNNNHNYNNNNNNNNNRQTDTTDHFTPCACMQGNEFIPLTLLAF